MKNGPTKGKGRAGDKPVAAQKNSNQHNSSVNSSAAHAAQVLAARLDYAARGWWTFPAPADGSKKSLKSAKHSNGVNWGATCDPAVIRKEFTQSRFKNQNTGLLTGSMTKVWVLETDTKEHGKDGKAALKALEAKHSPLPVTLMACSPSGSEHWYFNHPGDDIKVKNSASEIAAGVDVRGDGGMVLMPPSYRPPKPGKASGRYTWLNPGTPIADAPQWLVDLVKEQEHEAATVTKLNNRAPVEPATVAAMLQVLDPNMVEEQWRDVARGVFDALGENGWELFHDWSAKGKERYESPTSCRERWKHYSTLTKIKVGTLFHMADKADPKWRDALRAAQVAKNIEIGEEVDESVLPTILTLEEMNKRLVWIGSASAIVDSVTLMARKRDVAHTEYAASLHVFVDDKGKEKKVQALPLWLKSDNRTSVDVLAWVPGAAQICAPPEGEGRAMNTWRGLRPMNFPRDWKQRINPFLDHTAFLVPVDRERERFLQWLAHIIQCPEVLPHTSYLMTTRTTGIGRNLLVGMVTRVLRGHVANGVSLSKLLDGDFNGRLSKKLLATVDEVREGNSSSRYSRQEKLKSLITEEHRNINPKYGIPSVEKNCCRWLMLSNHLDAIPFDNSDRRIAVIENPTVPQPPAYYERLYPMLNDLAFIGSIRKALEEWDISKFKPGEPAPMNEAKLKALESMETETQRACRQFKADWKYDIAFRDDIVTLIGGDKVNHAHLTMSIQEAGMTNPGRDVRHGGRYKSVVVVRNQDVWTREKVKEVAADVLLKAMGRTEGGDLHYS
jgi:hypothetical protein